MARTLERKKALALKSRHYFTGVPCKRGHTAKRFTDSGRCVLCHREKEHEARKAGRRGSQPQPDRARFSPEEARRRKTASTRRWEQSNPAAVRAKHHRYRARKRSAEGSYTAAEISRLYALQRGRCVNCKVSLKAGFDADHITPLKLGGSNWINNIQLLCPPCNKRKQGTHPITWAQRQGRLI